MATFDLNYETADEQVKSHRIAVTPLEGETNWEALVRVVQARGLKLKRATAVTSQAQYE